MSLLNLLTTEHREIESHLTQIDAMLERHDAVEKVAHEFENVTALLFAHIEAEEKIVYKRLLDKEPTRDIAFDATAEHQMIVKILSQMQSPVSTDRHWRTLFKSLQDAITTHAREEEGPFMTEIRSFFTQAEIDQMAADMEMVEDPIREGDSKSEIFKDWFAERQEPLILYRWSGDWNKS